MAWLRGVNLGRRTVQSADLRACFTAQGFTEVETLLASGNVLFHAAPGPSSALRARIEAALHEQFGFEIGTVLRTRDELQSLIRSDPFHGRIEDANTKLYVFFLDPPVGKSLSLPCAIPGDFEVVTTTSGEICAVAHRRADGRFGPGLDQLGKQFAKGTLVTTRKWNTVLKAAR